MEEDSVVDAGAAEFEQAETTALAVVEEPHAVAEKRRERAENHERDDRLKALAFAINGTGQYYHSGDWKSKPGDKRKPEEVVAAAEKYYAFLTAGRKPQ